MDFVRRAALNLTHRYGEIMCLLFAALRVIPDCPVFFFMNREELWTRPTERPHLIDEPAGAAWFGGVDLQAGGTWLGVNQHGLAVALANRPKASEPETPRSRGLLCRDLLGRRTIDDAVEEVQRQSQAFAFAGFNVLLFERDIAMFVEAGDEFQVAELPSGTHALTNGRLNDTADARIARVLDEYGAMIQPVERLTAKIRAAQRVCGLKAEGGRPALCLHAAQRGTVSSTVVALTTDPARTQYHYAPGSPCVTPYDDYSPVVRQLLTGALP